MSLARLRRVTESLLAYPTVLLVMEGERSKTTRELRLQLELGRPCYDSRQY